MQSTIDFEARKLFEAIKYQIHVAIEYCHKLEDDQSLWIEVFGDVAVDREGAVEVKMWEDDLSDGHTNFWNTLHNWLKPAFDHERFEELVLLTTQSFGSRSTLSRWNESDPFQRLGLLTSINAAIGKRKSRKQESELPSDGTSPKQGKLTECKIPPILFLDQPTQVYFPALDKHKAFEATKASEAANRSDKKDADLVAVNNMFSQLAAFCVETEAETGLMPQVIVSDHADNLDLEDPYDFNSFVRRRWRDRGFIADQAPPPVGASEGEISQDT